MLEEELDDLELTHQVSALEAEASLSRSHATNVELSHNLHAAAAHANHAVAVSHQVHAHASHLQLEMEEML